GAAGGRIIGIAAVVRREHVRIAVKNAEALDLVLLDEVRDFAPLEGEPGPIIIAIGIAIREVEYLLRARRLHRLDQAIDVRLHRINIDARLANPWHRADPKDERIFSVRAEQ